MKLIFTTCMALASIITGLSANAQNANDSFYVSGHNIYDPCGNVFTPRGINYSVLDDWDFPASLYDGTELSAQIAQANPNAVRITWWRDYQAVNPDRPSYALSDLDSVISRFARKGIVSIVTLVDETGGNDATMFQDSIVSWWTSPQVVALVARHQKTMIVNIANEWGLVAYQADPVGALTAYQSAYNTAITSIRNAGIKTPLLIDGPDYANNMPAINSSGTVFTNTDPMHDVIMSEHAYWATSSTCASYSTADIQNDLMQLNSNTFPVLIGETADLAPSCDGSTQCAYNVNYGTLLTTCVQNNMGYLYWEWFDDCDNRQMSGDGTYSALTTVGSDIVNNSAYGLMAKAIKTPYMTNGQVCTGTSVNTVSQLAEPPIAIYIQAGQTQLQVNKTGDICMTDMYGKIVWRGNKNAGTTINLSQLDLPKGIYVVSYVGSDRYSVKTGL